MAGEDTRGSCEGVVTRIVLERRKLGKRREPAMYENSVVVRVDECDHPWSGMELPVPRKHACTDVAKGDRVRLGWPSDERRSWPDVYRVGASRT